MILAIDPGDVSSAYVVLDKEYKPISKGIIPNDEMLKLCEATQCEHLAIEMIASYGMSVGKSVFETCIWIGRFIQATNKSHTLIYRQEEKMNICHSMKANDSTIRQALIDRFGPVGTKKNPGWFYGFKKDMWAAYAVGCTYLDKVNNYNYIA